MSHQPDSARLPAVASPDHRRHLGEYLDDPVGCFPVLFVVVASAEQVGGHPGALWLPGWEHRQAFPPGGVSGVLAVPGEGGRVREGQPWSTPADRSPGPRPARRGRDRADVDGWERRHGPV